MSLACRQRTVVRRCYAFGNVAEDDRALRDDELEGQLSPEAAAVVPHTPPAADPGG
jgi:hypothetical protein